MKAQPQETTQSIIDTQVLESRLGLVFVPANSSDIVQAKLSKEEAFAKAQESGVPVKEATSKSLNNCKPHFSFPILTPPGNAEPMKT